MSEVYQLLRSQSSLLRLELLPFFVNNKFKNYSKNISTNNNTLRKNWMLIQQSNQLINKGRLLYNNPNNDEVIKNEWKALRKKFNNNTVKRIQSPIYSTLQKNKTKQMEKNKDILELTKNFKNNRKTILIRSPNNFRKLLLNYCQKVTINKKGSSLL